MIELVMIYVWRVLLAVLYYLYLLGFYLLFSWVTQFGTVLFLVGLIGILTPAPLSVCLVVGFAGLLVLVWSVLPPPRPKPHRY